MKSNYVIAELGMNHNGKIELAKKMIDQAKKCGCDAVKLQSMDWNSTIIEKELDQMITLNSGRKVNFGDYLKQITYSKKDHIDLLKYAKKMKIDLITTPFSFDYVKFTEKLDFKKLKIASQDVNNLKLIEAVAKTKKPIIISTGMSNLNEIIVAVNLIEKYNNNKVTILHCVSNYPTQAKDLNLLRIKTLKKVFSNHIIGLSDHTLGYEAAIIAKTFGAEVFEKHFTFDKMAEGFDHEMSVDAKLMRQYCKKIKDAYLALGSGNYNKIVDVKSAKVMRRSIIFKKNMKKGDKIKWSSLDYKRPGAGIPADKAEIFINKKLLKNVEKDQFVKYSDFD
tara:strand:+ start:4701 stop:5708 length:1008 start_codon:yes stop_codon:yes gene_type:complete